MLLAAWAEGVRTNWVGFGGLEEARPLLGVQTRLVVLAIVPLGYPARPVGHGRKDRKAMGAVASRERYGQAFD
jgi:hypothetical protein